MRNRISKSFFVLLLVIMAHISNVFAVPASEVDEESFLRYVGNLSSMYAQYNEYRLEFEFEYFVHDSDAAARGYRTVSVDDDRQSIKSNFVLDDSLPAVRNKYDEQTPRIREKMVITPSAEYSQILNDFGVSDLRKSSIDGKRHTYMGYPYRPLERLKDLSEAFELSRANGVLEINEGEIVCRFISTVEYAQSGAISSYSYMILKFESIDARFPKYIEVGQCSADFEHKFPGETIEIVVSDDSPIGYSEFVCKQFAPDFSSGEMVEKRYEMVRIASCEKAEPFSEDFRFLMKRGARMIDYSDDIFNPVEIEIDKETVIEAQ